MATYDPDKELARKIRDKQISPEDATAQMDALKAGNIPAAPVATAATAPMQNLVGLRDAAIQAGLQVGYDNDTKAVSINGTPINTAGLTNFLTTPPAGYKPNTYYGTQEQINQLLQPYIAPPPPSQNPEVQKALGDYQTWAQGSYDPKFGAELEGLVKNILTRQFQYDPANDAQFQLASKELTRNVMEAMNSRGILNSTVTQNQVQQGVSDLMPQYQQLARQQFMDEGQQLMSQVDMLMGIDETQYGRYQDEGQKLANVLGVVMDMDNMQYQRWTDAYERRYREQRDTVTDAQAKVEAERQKVKDMYEKWDYDGYADNDVALFFGVEPGTLSRDAREAKRQREQELEDAKTAYNRQLGLINAQYEKERKVAELREEMTTTDPAKLGDSQQVMYYNNALTYLLNQNGGDAYAAYQQLVRESKDYNASMGSKLYNKLLNDFKELMQTQKTYGSNYGTIDYSADPKYAEDMEDAKTNPEAFLEFYKANRQAFYDTYSPEGAQRLEQAASEQLEKNVVVSEKEAYSVREAKYQEYYTLAETDPKELRKRLKDETATAKIIDEVGIENYEKLKEKVK